MQWKSPVQTLVPPKKKKIVEGIKFPNPFLASKAAQQVLPHTKLMCTCSGAVGGMYCTTLKY
jgi:hypothetical protein